MALLLLEEDFILRWGDDEGSSEEQRHYVSRLMDAVCSDKPNALWRGKGLQVGACR